MDAFDRLYGNEALKRTLRGFSRRRAFPNSLTVSGAEGSGKTTVATLIAMAIACESEERPCGECKSCKKISQGLSPDVITITVPKDRRSIGVDSVRELRDGAYILPNDLSCKVYIIEEADKMTEAAQNALLKVFEEGPSRAYFILLTSNPSSLLTTVRSRAPELKTETFTRTALTELLTENSKKAADMKSGDPVAFSRILNVSGGSYGKALSLIESKSKKAIGIHERAEELIALMTEENGGELMLALISESSERERFAEILSLCRMGLRDLVAVKRGVDGLCLFASADRARELAARLSLNELLRLAEAVSEVLSSVKQINVNTRTAAVTLYCALRENG